MNHGGQTAYVYHSTQALNPGCVAISPRCSNTGLSCHSDDLLGTLDNFYVKEGCRGNEGKMSVAGMRVRQTLSEFARTGIGKYMGRVLSTPMHGSATTYSVDGSSTGNFAVVNFDERIRVWNERDTSGLPGPLAFQLATF